MTKKIIIYVFSLALAFTACSSKPKNKKGINLSKDDKVLFKMGECSRSRYNNVALHCLKKYENHVFQGKVLSVDFAYSGVESIVDIGSQRISCHSHPTDQNFNLLKKLLVGDWVAVHGEPDRIYGDQGHSRLLLKNCTLLPIRR